MEIAGEFPGLAPRRNVCWENRWFWARRAAPSQSGVEPPHSKIHIDESVDVDEEKARGFCQ
jgi:hypothetical protein